METDPRWGSHGPSAELRVELQSLAKAAGVFAPHVDPHYGGLGLGHVGRALVFEEAGYSMLGPTALNIAAPDEGNMHMLEMIATPEQKEQFLRPLAMGECRSCFAMTEPAPGAGSDPSMLQTEVRRDGDECVINGLKWLITGASGARYAICMARVEGTSGRDSKATMLFVPMDTPGVSIERDLDTMDSSFTGGHGVVRFADVRVPAANILGEWGEGMRYAQVRLAPARLTHCMRWLGAARRAHDVAAAYAAEREAFGQKLGRHEGVSYMLADNEMAIRAARLQIWHTAWLLDQGADGGYESSIAKTFVSEAVWGVVDRSLQVLGGRGITRETVVERIFRDVRAFRIYDGPSEVHRWSIGRRIVKAAGA